MVATRPTCLHFTRLCPPPPQPSPSRREDRPVSFYQLGSSQLQPNAMSLARDAASLAKDKQRSFVPSILQNETYGAILSSSPPPAQPAAPGTASAPPLPPRNVAKGTELLVALPGHGRGAGALALGSMCCQRADLWASTAGPFHLGPFVLSWSAPRETLSLLGRW